MPRRAWACSAYPPINEPGLAVGKGKQLVVCASAFGEKPARGLGVDPRQPSMSERASHPVVLTPVPEIHTSAFIERAWEQLPWFAAVLLVSAAVMSRVSTERRRRLGLTKFLLGYLCIAALPLSA